MTPRAQTVGLQVHELPDEVLVFDARTQRSHCLNRTAAAVWRACDGTRDIPALMRSVSNELGQPLPRDVVELALGQLHRRGLVDEATPTPQGDGRLSRRQALKYFAAACALPLIATAKVRAQTVVPVGAACFGTGPGGSPLFCVTGACCFGTCVDPFFDPNNCGGCGFVCPPVAVIGPGGVVFLEPGVCINGFCG
jgi:hypothetical protein